MRLLVTRPREDAVRWVAALEAAGHASVEAPLLRIVLRTEAPDLAGVQALVFTSANGVRAFAANAPVRDLPAFAVGARTAEEAQAAGFADVLTAEGDVAALAALVETTLDPAEGALLHVAGSAVAGDLAGTLGRAGFAVRRAVLYDSVPADTLPATAVAALTEGRLDGVSFFSPRTAESFARLVRAAGLAETTARLTAYCLSDAVAAKARDLPWAHVRVAAAPTQDALLAVIAAEAASGMHHGGSATTGTAKTGTATPQAITTEERAMADQGDKRDEETGTGVPAPGSGADRAGTDTPDAAPQTGGPEAPKPETPESDESGAPSGAPTADPPAADTTQDGEPPEAPAAAGPGETEPRSHPGDEGNVAEAVIARFGGLRPTATKLGVAVSTVQGWKARGHVPAARHDEIRAAAAKHDVDLAGIDLEAEAEAEKAGGRPVEASKAEAAGGIKGGGPTGAETTELAGVTTGPGPNPWGGSDDGGSRDDAGEAAVADEPALAERPGTPGAAKPGTDRSESASDSSVPPSAMPPPPPPKGGSGSVVLGFVLAVLLFAGGAVAAAYTRDLWEPYFPGAADPAGQEVAALRERLQALEQDTGQGVDPQAVAELESRVEALQGRMSALSEDVGAAAEAAAQAAEAASAGAGDGPSDGAAGADLEPLRARLDTLESRLTEIAENASAQAAQAADAAAAGPAIDPALVGALQDRVATLQDNLEALREDAAADAEAAVAEAEGTATALSEQVASLQAELRAVAARADEATRTRNSGSGFALALGQLRDALRFAEPFEAELTAVRTLTPADDPLQAELETLAGHAGSGVPTRDDLRQRFEPMAELVVAASYDDSWGGRLMARVSEAVSVRPVGEVEGDSARARIARADARLAAGNLAGAVQALEGLEGEAAQQAEPWIADARARLAAERALAELTRRTLARLTPTANDAADDAADDAAGADGDASGDTAAPASE